MAKHDLNTVSGFTKALSIFVSTSMKRRDHLQELGVAAAKHARQWNTQPMTALFNALETIRSDDRRAYLTWLLRITGSFRVTNAGHVTDLASGIITYGHKEKKFSVRKLNKTEETQAARELRFDHAIDHYSGVKWYAFTPEKTTRPYSFTSLKSALNTAMKNASGLTAQERAALYDIVERANAHGFKIESPHDSTVDTFAA